MFSVLPLGVFRGARSVPMRERIKRAKETDSGETPRTKQWRQRTHSVQNYASSVPLGSNEKTWRSARSADFLLPPQQTHMAPELHSSLAHALAESSTTCCPACVTRPALKTPIAN